MDTIEFKVIKRKRRTACIRITPQNEVHIIVPSHFSKFTIDQLVSDNAKWIQKKLTEQKTKTCPLSKRTFLPQDIFLFLGEPLVLVHKQSNYEFIRVEDKQLIVGHPYIFKSRNQEKTYYQDKVLNWYLEECRIILTSRIKYFAKILAVDYNIIRIKSLSSRWGSCSSRKNLNFNWKIIMAPREVMDYLIVHELCHLKEQNHSKAFWKLVQSTLPNYRKPHQWLKEHGHTLTFE